MHIYIQIVPEEMRCEHQSEWLVILTMGHTSTRLLLTDAQMASLTGLLESARCERIESPDTLVAIEVETDD